MNLLPTATRTDVQEKQPRVAVLPVGFFEQHGRYLPLITDTAIACFISQEVAGAYPCTCSRQLRCRAATSTLHSQAS